MVRFTPELWGDSKVQDREMGTLHKIEGESASTKNAETRPKFIE